MKQCLVNPISRHAARGQICKLPVKNRAAMNHPELEALTSQLGMGQPIFRLSSWTRSAKKRRPEPVGSVPRLRRGLGARVPRARPGSGHPRDPRAGPRHPGGVPVVVLNWSYGPLRPRLAGDPLGGRHPVLARALGSPPEAVPLSLHPLRMHGLCFDQSPCHFLTSRMQHASNKASTCESAAMHSSNCNTLFI